MAADIRSALPPLHAERALNVDGTTAELAALAGSRTVTLAAIDEALAWVVGSSDEERRSRLVEPDRSDVLAAGVVVVRETLRHLGLTETTASDRDLLNGVALAAARLPEPEEGEAPPGAYTCC
jgi:exopolyphosphatase/pppGpp-phosphohydrolase